MSEIVLFPVALCIFAMRVALDIPNAPAASPLFASAIGLLLLCVSLLLGILLTRVDAAVALEKFFSIAVLTC